MMGAFRTRTGWRAFGAWALACALALRILIAPGMMPVADAGGVRVTLCTGEGPVQVTVDRDGNAHRGDPGQDDPRQDKAIHQACAFSSLSAASLLSDGPAYAAAEPIAPIAPAARPSLPARAPPARVLPPATGPPLLA